jgi:zona occludens toxin (predicted ATPase)
MIELYAGRIGGGKTYNAVLRMMKYISAGGAVCTNINLNIEECRKYLHDRHKWELKEGQIIILDEDYVEIENEKGKSEKIKKITVFHRYTPQGTKESPVLVVIDEAHFHFPNAMYGRIPQETVEFLTMSRHHSTDIILISQHIKNIAGQFQRLCEYVWSFRDMRRFGMPVRILFMEFCIPWPLNQIRFNRHDFTGNYINGGMVWKDKEVFKLYDSPELINKFERAGTVEKFTDGKVKRKMELSMKSKLVYVLLGIMVGIFAAGFLHRESNVSAAVTADEIPISDLQKDEKQEEEEKVKLHGVFRMDNGEHEIWYSNKVYRVGENFKGNTLIHVTDKDLIMLGAGNQLMKVPYEI